MRFELTRDTIELELVAGDSVEVFHVFVPCVSDVVELSEPVLEPVDPGEDANVEDKEKYKKDFVAYSERLNSQLRRQFLSLFQPDDYGRVQKLQSRGLLTLEKIGEIRRQLLEMKTENPTG